MNTKKQKIKSQNKAGLKQRTSKFLLLSILLIFGIVCISAITYTSQTKNFIANSSTYFGHTNVSNPVVQVYNETGLNFNPSDFSSVAITNFSFNNQSNYTFVISLNLKSASTFYTIFSNNDISIIAENNYLEFWNVNDFTNIKFVPIPLNVPVNFAFVFNGKNKSIGLYYNGSFQSNSYNDFNWNNLPSSSNDGVIGLDISWTYPFNGSIYNFRIFNTTLSSLEIQDSFQKEGNYFNYSINKTLYGSDWHYDNIFQFNSTRSYVNDYGIIKRSDDGGSTWTNLATGTNEGYFFNDSFGNIFFTNYNSGNISRTNINNDSNWSQIQVMSCLNKSGEGFGYVTWMGFTQAKDGSLLFAEYFTGDSTKRNCSYIHKSTDHGLTWNVVYNGSSTYPEAIAKHMHLIKTDPYTGYIYATQGDDPPASRLLRSIDNGTTWTSLQNISTSAISQYTSVFFLPNCRIFSTDDYSLNGFVKTCNDINFQKIYTLPSDADGEIWDILQDPSTGYLISNTIPGDNLENVYNISLFLVSPNNGTNWFSTNIQYHNISWEGVRYINNFNSNGYAYFTESPSGSSYKFNLLNAQKIDSVFSLNLNENNGSIAYDSSGNGNNGTISGATWFNDGILKTLTNGVDYSVNSATGFLDILDNSYLYSWLMTSFDYSNEIYITSLTNGATYTTNTLDINITGDEELSSCNASINGGSSFSLDSTGVIYKFEKLQYNFPDGTVNLVVSCNDTSGNWVSTSMTFNEKYCSNLDNTGFNLILLFFALAILGLEVGYFYIRKDDFKVYDIIIMFIIVLVGVIFWSASADSLTSQCGVIG